MPATEAAMLPSGIPVIDLAPFLAGTAAGKQAVARAIGEACETIGFFTVVGHGVDPALVQRTAELSRAFFDLPMDEKQRIKRPAPEQNRGYNAIGQETLSYSIGEPAPPDFKEFLSIGPVDVPEHDPYYTCPDSYPHFAPNLWPARPAALRDTWIAYFHALDGLAGHLMRAFALALDLPEQIFADKIDRSISMMRVLNYPDQATEPLPGQLRATPHSDYGTLTILKSENVAGGLQVKNRAGDWIDAIAAPDSFVVNLGDLMAVWTNDRWVSTLHRVVNPPRDRLQGYRRQSIVFFHQPNYDALITCLESCQGPGNPPRHAPVTSGEHRLQKFLKASKLRQSAA
jgi:isopenicillin N synthase-like dioxygenase